MKTRRFKYGYRKSSSKLHRKVGEALRKEGGIFANFKTYQEYPVNRINKDFFSGAYKFDWVVLDLFLVIEAHGQQHYQPIDFGGQGEKTARENFAFIQASDYSKKMAAINAGFTYIEIPYFDYDIITEDYIWQKYKENFNDKEISSKEQDTSDLEEGYKSQLQKKAKKYRQEQYKKQKEFFKALGRTRGGQGEKNVC